MPSGPLVFTHWACEKEDTKIKNRVNFVFIRMKLNFLLFPGVKVTRSLKFINAGKPVRAVLLFLDGAARVTRWRQE
jgi:hypothetical protein